VSQLKTILAEIRNLIEDSESAEIGRFEQENIAGERKFVLVKLKKGLIELRAQREKARTSPIRGSFWHAIDDCTSLLGEIDEVIE